MVGDVDPNATLKKSGPCSATSRQDVCPPATCASGVRRSRTSFCVDTDRPNGTQMLAMRVPGLNSPDFPALEVLADVLSSQRFDLYGLVPQGKAIDATFALDPLPQAGLAMRRCPSPKARIPGADVEVRVDPARVARTACRRSWWRPPSSRSAARRNSRKIRSQGLASIWADAVALYGLDSPEEDLERIEKVTVADVNRVARRYLDSLTRCQP